MKDIVHEGERKRAVLSEVKRSFQIIQLVGITQKWLQCCTAYLLALQDALQIARCIFIRFCGITDSATLMQGSVSQEIVHFLNIHSFLFAPTLATALQRTNRLDGIITRLPIVANPRYSTVGHFEFVLQFVYGVIWELYVY